MNVLVVLNYQREIPPFMLTELRYAAQEFDKVIYVTRELQNNNFYLIHDENVFMKEIKKSNRFLSLLKLPILFFRKEIRREAIQVILHKRNIFQYFQYLGKELYCSQNLYHAAHPVIDELFRQGANITIEAAWFDVSAYASAKLKEKYSSIQAVSFAHAFEINPKVSGFVGYSCDEYKLNELDDVYFIAKGMREIYKSALPQWITYNAQKLHVRYLGNTRYFKLSENRRKNQSTVICSCSSMVDLKRIQIIIETLALWSGSPIMWIHLGGGPLMDELTKLSKEKLDGKVNVQYNFMGKLENIDVHKFYRDNYVDLFLNVSESEGLPVSIMEAISYGIPAMATDVGATREVVRNNELLLPADVTPEILLERLSWFVKLSISEREKMGREVMNIWEENFNADITGKKYYDNLVRMK